MLGTWMKFSSLPWSCLGTIDVVPHVVGIDVGDTVGTELVLCQSLTVSVRVPGNGRSCCQLYLGRVCTAVSKSAFRAQISTLIAHAYRNELGQV